jgi:Tripartite tricarboxylate transporter family receptor
MKPFWFLRPVFLSINLAALIAVLLLPLLTTVRADETLAGKTVTIYVPVAPGGGYDTYARLVARHIRKHLPGDPTVIVKNMPGAGGIILANYISAVAAKDGTEFAILQDANLFEQLTTTQQLPYDARTFGYLGALEKFVPIVLAWHTTRFNTFEDTKKEAMSVGSDGPGSSTDYFPRVLNAFFGTKFRIVRGYKGSADITLAIERGELDGLCSWCYDCMKAQKPNWVAENSARILLQLALEGDPELDAKGVPKVGKAARSIGLQRRIGGTALRDAAGPRTRAPRHSARRFRGDRYRSRISGGCQAGAKQHPLHQRGPHGGNHRTRLRDRSGDRAEGARPGVGVAGEPYVAAAACYFLVAIVMPAKTSA